MERKRRNYAPEQKLALVLRHLKEKTPVSEICRQEALATTLFYHWKEQLFSRGAEAFRRSCRKTTLPKQKSQEPLTKAEQEEYSRRWMLELIQGKFDQSDLLPLLSDYLRSNELRELINCVIDRPLRFRNRAVFVLAYLKGIPVPAISRFLLIPRQRVYLWAQLYRSRGCADFLNPPYISEYRKCKDKEYIDAIFAIIHAPPKSYGINRTSWRQSDIHTVMKREGFSISKGYIGQIVKDAGYHYRKAKKVLTSTDPDYHEKLRKITGILSVTSWASTPRP